MGATIVATLAGEPILADRTTGWAFRAGATPYQRQIELTRRSAAIVRQKAAGNKPVTLAFNNAEIEGLFVVGEAPTDHPHRAALVLADLRWLWQYVWVLMRFNVRRKTGQARWLEGAVLDTEIADDVAFAAWSLKGASAAWSAREVVEEVIKVLQRKTRDILLWDYDPIPDVRETAVESLEVDDRGDRALQRTLQYVAGLQPWITPDAHVAWIDRLDGTGVHAANNAGVPVVGPTLPVMVDKTLIMPQKFRILFSRYIEVRHDYVEEEKRLGTTVRLGAGEDPRRLDMVTPIPLKTMTPRSLALAGGTIVDFEDFFLAANKVTKAATGLPDLGHEIIRDLWVRGLLMGVYAAPGGLQPNLDWGRIIGAVYANYRQMFRLPKYWQQRFLLWKPERVGIVDNETGSIAQAVVWADHAIQPDYNRFGTSTGDDMHVAWNQPGYAELLADATPSPARVVVVDHDTGVFRVQFDLPFWRTGTIYPSQFEADTIGTLDPAAPLTQQNIEGMNLAEDHRLAVILTMVPAAPNDDRQLHAEEVELTEVFNKLGIRAQAGQGPVMELRIDPGVTAARWAWKDDAGHAAAVEAAFGIGAGDPSALGEPLDQRQVHDVAVAAAAQYVVNVISRMEGAVAVPVNFQLMPTGNLTEVEHALHPSGSFVTVGRFPAVQPSLSLIGLLNEGTRRRLFRATIQ